jgi:hypothetical protein
MPAPLPEVQVGWMSWREVSRQAAKTAVDALTVDPLEAARRMLGGGVSSGGVAKETTEVNGCSRGDGSVRKGGAPDAVKERRRRSPVSQTREAASGTTEQPASVTEQPAGEGS